MNASVRSGTGVRVATAALLLPLVVAAVWFGGPVVMTALVIATVIASLWEFFGIGAQQGLRGYRLWTLLTGAALAFSQVSEAGTQWIPAGGGIFFVGWHGLRLSHELVFVVFILGLGTLAVAGKKPLSNILPSLGLSAAGLLLVAWPLSYIVRIHAMENGRLWLLFTLALIWAGDTLAYFTGRAIGRHAMAPQVSPKKTWEGAAGNVAGSVMVAAVFSNWLDVGMAHLVAIALLANVAGQLGDLVESAYKRGAGVKDSGTLLPGHGGMLDRVDALIFAAPVVWAYLQWMV